jgi:hypothetical protein
VTALLDQAHGFETVTTETDDDGNYCLELPAGAGYSIRGEREVDLLLQTTMEILGFAPGAQAECGSDECALLAPIQFEEASCTTGRLVDNFGDPIASFPLTFSYLGPDGGNEIALTTDDEGRYCVGVPRGAAGRITAERLLPADRNLRYADAIDLVGGLTAISCESVACPEMEDLVLPRTTCYRGRIENPDGSPGYMRRVDLIYDPLDGAPQAVREFGDMDGNFCLTVPQGVEVTMSASFVDGTTNVAAFASFVAEEGDSAQCSAGGCLEGPVLRAAPYACTSGVVRDALGASVAGATVIGQYTFRTAGGVTETTATTGADGTYCLDLPPGAEVTLAAQIMVGGVLHAGGTMFVPGVGSATCSTGGCAPGPDIVVSEARGCIYGTLFTDGPSAHPAPPGTRIAIYTSEPNADCSPGADDPSSWGTVAGEGTTGDGGAFCFDVPVVPPGTNLWHGIDACNFASGDTNYLVRVVQGPIAPGDCAVSGCVGPLRLFAR